MEQIKPGYKRTEVGIIPEDWKLKRIDKVANVTSGGTPARQNAAYWNGNIPWITTTQIDFNLITTAHESITQAGIDNSAARIYETGALLMAMYGQGKTRGKVARLGIRAAINQACAAISIFGKVDDKYLFFNLASRYDEIRNLSNIGNQENLNIGIIEAINIPLPPTLTEQQAIAEALSEVDAQITALDDAIAKKRDIKQGAMQRLLTGEERLPGFDGAWEENRLGCQLTIKHGKSQHGIADSNGIYPILATGGEIGKTNTPLYSEPSVLIGRKGTIDVPQYMDTPFWTVDTLFYSEISTHADAKFLFYLFQMIDWYSYNEASGVPSLNAKTIENIEIMVPSEKAEQTAISIFLSDMDAEISALEDKREKTVALKQGMMQELLTGKTRLV
jgi:type I restriction enzyme, S subunit